jgi:hypothetical protein
MVPAGRRMELALAKGDHVAVIREREGKHATLRTLACRGACGADE